MTIDHNIIFECSNLENENYSKENRHEHIQKHLYIISVKANINYLKIINYIENAEKSSEWNKFNW